MIRLTNPAFLWTPRPAGLAPGGVERFLLQLLTLSAERTYGTAGPADLYTRMYSVPWVPGETERLQRFLTKPEDAIAAGFNPHGVIPRINGSPFYSTRVPDLHLLSYNKYIDDPQRRVAYRLADEVLYAIGVYLLSLAQSPFLERHRLRAKGAGARRA